MESTTRVTSVSPDTAAGTLSAAATTMSSGVSVLPTLAFSSPPLTSFSHVLQFRSDSDLILEVKGPSDLASVHSHEWDSSGIYSNSANRFF